MKVGVSYPPPSPFPRPKEKGFFIVETAALQRFQDRSTDLCTLLWSVSPTCEGLSTTKADSGPESRESGGLNADTPISRAESPETGEHRAYDETHDASHCSD